MDQTLRFQEILRKLSMIDEGFIERETRIGLSLAGTSALDVKTAALLRVGASVATGSSAACLHWSITRATAAGATEDEIAECCWRSPRWPGSAGSPPPLPTWRSRSATTLRPRWRSWTIPDGVRICAPGT